MRPFLHPVLAALLAMAAASAQANPMGEISGTVNAPPGETLEGVQVSLCEPVAQACIPVISTWIEGTPSTAAFSFADISSDVTLRLVGHRDINLDPNPANGDFYAVLDNISAPAQGLVLNLQRIGPPGAADPRFVLKGALYGPPREDLAGTTVRACRGPSDCVQVTATPEPWGGGGKYSISVPGRGPWELQAWKDINGDGQINAGDLEGHLQKLEPPQYSAGIMITPVGGAAGTLQQQGQANTSAAPMPASAPPAASTASVPAPAELAGSWSYEGRGKELVMEQQLYYSQTGTAPGQHLFSFGQQGIYGTDVGARQVTTPKDVARTMYLAILPDSSFTWVTHKTVYRDKGCEDRTRSDKRGTLLPRNGKLVFQIESGEESFEDSCSAARNAKSRIAPRDEEYTAVQEAGGLRLTGPGGVNWLLQRK
ncbi:MAG: hypothetical protein M3O22_03025 [Pseudomonadota bacterium]|nr:hypothetical protein [Pseudomonadota bacterium]